MQPLERPGLETTRQTNGNATRRNRAAGTAEERRGTGGEPGDPKRSEVRGSLIIWLIIIWLVVEPYPSEK